MTDTVRGNQALAALKTQLRRMPLTVAHAVAQRASPALTGLTDGAFDAMRTVYDDPRPEGVNGQPLSLVQSGTTRSTLRFVATGTIVRCVLAKRYMRYLIGKYRVLPNGPLPVGWRRSLDALVQTTKVPA